MSGTIGRTDPAPRGVLPGDAARKGVRKLGCAGSLEHSRYETALALTASACAVWPVLWDIAGPTERAFGPIRRVALRLRTGAFRLSTSRAGVSRCAAMMDALPSC